MINVHSAIPRRAAHMKPTYIESPPAGGPTIEAPRQVWVKTRPEVSPCDIRRGAQCSDWKGGPHDRHARRRFAAHCANTGFDSHRASRDARPTVVCGAVVSSLSRLSHHRLG